MAKAKKGSDYRAKLLSLLAEIKVSGYDGMDKEFVDGVVFALARQYPDMVDTIIDVYELQVSGEDEIKQPMKVVDEVKSKKAKLAGCDTCKKLEFSSDGDLHGWLGGELSLLRVLADKNAIDISGLNYKDGLAKFWAATKGKIVT